MTSYTIVTFIKEGRGRKLKKRKPILMNLEIHTHKKYR